MGDDKTLDNMRPAPVSGALSASSRISRRQFIKIAAAAAGLLAGCRPTQPPPPAPTSAPTAVPTSAPSATPAPTNTPMPTHTPVPTATQAPTPAVRRPDIIKMYPDVPSKVVHTHHTGVWDGETLVPEAIRQMLDASIAQLAGLDDPAQAWAALFDPGERIAIKVNTIRNSRFWTHVPLVTAVTACLQEIGIPSEQIVVFDRRTDELENAGFTSNRNEPGVRLFGTDGRYVTWDGIDPAGWKVEGLYVGLSDILLECDALINVPLLKEHDMTGVSFAMKNHYGTFDRPYDFHTGERMRRGLAGLNALPPIRDRTRLVIGDVLAIARIDWESAVTGDSILMSFDPVAHDTVGLQLLTEATIAEGRNPEAAINLASGWLEHGAELGLGTNDPDNMELVETNLA